MGPSKSRRHAIYYKNQVIVLTYHHIDPLEHGIAISPKRFKSHMKALKQNGYNVISMDSFIQFKCNKKKVPPNAVVVTFDDGYESFYSYAYPILKKYKYPATNFIVVKLTDDNVPPPKLSYDEYYPHPRISWKQARKMKRDRMSFFSHTYNHHLRNREGRPILRGRYFLKKENRNETDQEYVQRVKEDLSIADQRIRKELGRQPKLLSFPYGAYNKDVTRIGKELGIKLFFTIKRGMNNRKGCEVFRLNAGTVHMNAKDLMKKMRRLSQ